jgi:hypothetical protein
MSRVRPLPGARRPSLRWYMAYARLVYSRVVERFAPPSMGRIFRVLLVVWGLRLLSQVPEVLHGQTAIYQWVVQLIILIISAIIQAAMTPKPKAPEPQKANIPVVEEGKGIEIIFGTVWIDDPTVLAFKEILPHKKIKAKGGKK